MTREEALILWLPVIADGVKNLPKCKEALDIAIRALKNEQTDGDLISRDYTIQQIQKAKESNYNFNYNTLIDFIKALPSADKQTESEEIQNDINRR